MIVFKNIVKNIAATTNVLHKRWKHYMTTPIFYVNSGPHVGHLYTALLADALCRYERLKNPERSVILMTGTDEHGLKIQQTAKSLGTPEQQYVDHVSRQYRDLFRIYNVEYQDFVRTTDERHVQSSRALWKMLMDSGHIYKGEYSGWYCIPDEAFIAEQMLHTDESGTKRTIEGNRPVEFIREVNYKFRLSSFKADLLHWLKEDRINPAKFQRMLVDWIEEGSVLEDISVSRPRRRVPWGIPVPEDEDQTIYVWLDALSSYLTSVGFPDKLNSWPPDAQIMGKDILKFHAIYWPAFLMGAGLEPPKKLLCHSHWIVDGEKMSKTKGNVINPFKEAEIYGCDGFRYFLLREGVPHSDGNYTTVKVQRILNSELADTLGNLLNRCTGNLVNQNQIFPAFSPIDHANFCSDEATELLLSVEALPDLVDNFYSNFELYKGIDCIIATLHLANQFFEIKKPWELRKKPEHSEELNSVLHVTMEILRVCGILLLPITPTIASQLLNKLNVPEEDRNIHRARELSWRQVARDESLLSGDKITLFQRIR